MSFCFGNACILTFIFLKTLQKNQLIYIEMTLYEWELEVNLNFLLEDLKNGINAIENMKNSIGHVYFNSRNLSIGIDKAITISCILSQAFPLIISNSLYLLPMSLYLGQIYYGFESCQREINEIRGDCNLIHFDLLLKSLMNFER